MILLTDRPNKTGSCQNPDNPSVRDNDAGPYMNYLRKMGVDVSVFKNRAKTTEEEQEDQLLGNANENLEFFVKLTHDQKSSYIGRGHHLTNRQFDFVMKNSRTLLEQYISVGSFIGDYQFEIGRAHV